VDGAAVFGATSKAVQGSVDLTPQVTAQTRLADLKGANGLGIRPGSVLLGNGATSKVIDLSHADSVGDVAAAIDAAGVGNVTAAVGPGGSLTLSGTGADNITVDEVAGGSTASDLGLYHPTASGAGAPVNGAGLQPVVSPLTPLSDLRGGLGIDTAHGLVITNGTAKATVALTSPPLPTPPTVQDLLNAINGSGADVLARVNPAGTGIDIVNPVQGTKMTIAENGGTTAADLGVLSFSGATLLSTLNGGKGVGTIPGADFQVTRADGSTFGVDVDGAKTVQDAIDKINAADTGNGAQPAKLVASLSADGSGITLTDSTGGAGAVSVSAAGGSTAAGDLGLTGPGATAAGNVLSGADVGQVGADGIFANLAKLRDALSNNDQGGITAAAQGLQTDQDRVIAVRGSAGATAQALQAKQTQLGDEDLATNTLLSSLQDTDFTKAITQFQSLQTALQATLETASRTLQLSLMNFLQ
jgi:flagellar hook-associated protein 2